jgi:hypothetical protein
VTPITPAGPSLLYDSGDPAGTEAGGGRESKGKRAMIRFETHEDGDGRNGAERTRRFVTTLIVATLMTATTAYVLGYAVIAPERVGSTHGANAAAQHARS